MDRQANIKRFEKEMEKVERPGADRLMGYIRKSDFYSAPASTKYHLSVTGGLLQHSLNVLDSLKSRLRDNKDGTYSYMVSGKNVATITEESIAVIALLHDICKTYFYTTELRNRKVNGKWEQYEAFAVDDQVPYGHGEKSVMMIEEFMKLKAEERYAIRWHMGYTEGGDNYSLNTAIEKYPIIWALHCADMEASHFMEGRESNLKPYAEEPAAQGAGQYADNPATGTGEQEPVFEEATPI